MEQTMKEALVQLRRIYNALGEVEDLSRQLAEALDRNDQVTVTMLLSMREEPVMTAHRARETLGLMIDGSAAGQRLRAVLNGAEPENNEEKLLVNQAAMNERLLKKVQELDRVLSGKIARDKSIYQN